MAGFESGHLRVAAPASGTVTAMTKGSNFSHAQAAAGDAAAADDALKLIADEKADVTSASSSSRFTSSSSRLRSRCCSNSPRKAATTPSLRGLASQSYKDEAIEPMLSPLKDSIRSAKSPRRLQ
jgi:hypothetical protein